MYHTQIKKIQILFVSTRIQIGVSQQEANRYDNTQLVVSMYRITQRSKPHRIVSRTRVLLLGMPSIVLLGDLREGKIREAY
jgi:hypothetical protein